MRRIFWQHDVVTLIVFVNDHIYVFTGNGGRCVHVRDEADDRHFRIVRQIASHGGVNDTKLAQTNILRANLPQLFGDLSKRRALVVTRRCRR